MSSPIGVSPKGPAGRTGRRGRSRISRKVTTAAILPGGRSVYPSALSAIVGSSGGIDSVLLVDKVSGTRAALHTLAEGGAREESQAGDGCKSRLAQR